MTEQSPLKQTAIAYRYHALVAVYILSTSFFFYRVLRQPYRSSVKWEQYESIFKATTLASVLVGIGMGGGLNKRRTWDSRYDQAR